MNSSSPNSAQHYDTYTEQNKRSFLNYILLSSNYISLLNSSHQHTANVMFLHFIRYSDNADVA